VARGRLSTVQATGKELVMFLFSNLDARFKAADGITGVRTGIPSLDDAGGVFPSEVVVIGGRTGAGKTSLAISAALHAAKQQTHVLYVALSERMDEIAERALCAEAKVSKAAVRRGQIKQGDMTNLTLAAAEIAQLPLKFEDCVEASAMDLRKLVQAWRAEMPEGVSALVIVDYVQLLAPDERANNREYEMAAALRSISAMAKETGAAVVLVSQLNRRSNGRSDPRPLLEDLRDSGALEGVAAAVLFLHHATTPEVLQVVTAKHRRLAPRIDECDFDASTGTFVFARAAPPVQAS